MDKLNTKKVVDPLVSVIVPMYNEEASVGEVLKHLTFLAKKLSLEIIAVDDGSTDNTREIVELYPSVKLVSSSTNLGKGSAIAAGLSKSQGQIVVIQDADLEYSPNEIPSLIKPILDRKTDVVFGSRFLGQAKNMSLSHLFGNRILSLAFSLLFNTNLTDVMTGHKVFSKKSLDSIKLTEAGFEIEIEITAKILKKGCAFIELPINYTYRTTGEAKIGYLDGLKCLIKLLRWKFFK